MLEGARSAEEMRTLSAKLSDNPTEDSVGFCDGLAASEDADAKGLDVELVLELELIEKGFVVCGAED